MVYHAPAMVDGQPTSLRRWRLKVFISSWLSYVGMYFCRKPFYIVKGSLTKELGLGASALADIGSVYLTCYTIGQFLAGAVGSITGSRRMLLVGMAISMGCNLIFGGAAGYWVLMVFMGVNGLAQATGWSGNVGTMAQWTRRGERGTIMGLWATCYLVGGILANSSASLMVWWRGWRSAFFGGAVVFCAIIIAFFFMQRDRPEDVGLPPLSDDEEDEGAGAGAGSAAPSTPKQKRGALARLGWDRQVLVTLLLVGGFYFFIKFIRYALWSWAPYLLELNFGVKGYQAGFLATTFDAAGFFGVMTAGVASDRLFKGRRTMVALLMLVGLVGGCLLLYSTGHRSVTHVTVAMGIIGFTLYGPDSLLSGAGAVDLGGRAGATAAAGIINGMGATGSLVQEKVIGGLYERSGGAVTPIFFILLGSSALALLFVVVVLWRNRLGKSDL
jgi:OPA family sugar phosphate sensor protein UhpC-like MFS transporter